MTSPLYTINNIPVWFAPGLPDNYRGNRLRGSIPWHAAGNWGQVIIQEIRHLHYHLQYRVYYPKTTQHLTVISSESGLTTTAALKNTCRQTIIGAGKLPLREEQFASLFASSWNREMVLQESTTLITLDTTWSKTYLKQMVPGEQLDKWTVQIEATKMPVLVGAPFRPFSMVISDIIERMLWTPYTAELTEVYRDELMQQYLMEIIVLSTSNTVLTEGISPKELVKVAAARELIAGNPDTHFRIGEIAKSVGMNACTLKMRFRQMMGKSMFEYLLYIRCLRARDAILASDFPLKAFYKEAGYSTLANFVVGFKKHIGCYPSELRK